MHEDAIRRRPKLGTVLHPHRTENRMSKNMKRSILTLAIIPLLLVIGCGPAEEEGLDLDADTLGAEGTQEERMDFRNDVDEDLADINTRIDSLAMRADEAAGDVSAELDSTVASLRERSDSVGQEIQQLDLASDVNFDNIRNDIEAGLNDLESDVETAWERFDDDDVVVDPDAS